ncbi:MAG: thioredoxin domain-containing protein [Nitrospira sp.]|nr:thioredoxin domain-containing protein [Nitrospira sp.]
MKVTWITGIVCCLAGFSLFLFTTDSFMSTASRQPSVSEIKSQVVATVGTRAITHAEVEQAVALPLYQLEEQRTKLLKESIQRLIDEELLTAEAARLGITVATLIEKASESETVARLAGLPGPVRRTTPLSQKQPSELSPQAPEEVTRIRQALLLHLRRQTSIQINLPRLNLPILNVSIDDDPWIGTERAPITIIEFSDFECPYCQRIVPLLKELLKQYSGKLKLVYRDFPGPNHQQALLAAEAAQCAAEQNRFWDYHDALFSRQPSEGAWNFSGLAETLGLSLSQFNVCMQDNRYRAEVLKDLQDGLKLGVTSTPTFFINGRPLIGARPFSDFQAIIDPLLK